MITVGTYNNYNNNICTVGTYVVIVVVVCCCDMRGFTVNN